jgi:hypothetical protein
MNPSPEIKEDQPGPPTNSSRASQLESATRCFIGSRGRELPFQ